jgi:hypothetical protein
MFSSAAMRDPSSLLPMPCGHHTSRAKLGDDFRSPPKPNCGGFTFHALRCIAEDSHVGLFLVIRCFAEITRQGEFYKAPARRGWGATDRGEVGRPEVCWM